MGNKLFNVHRIFKNEGWEGGSSEPPEHRPLGSATGVPSHVVDYSIKLSNKWFVKTEAWIICIHRSLSPMIYLLVCSKVLNFSFQSKSQLESLFIACAYYVNKSIFMLVYLLFCLTRHFNMIYQCHNNNAKWYSNNINSFGVEYSFF